MFKYALPGAMAALIAGPALSDTAMGLAGDRTLVQIDLSAAQVVGMIEADVEGRLLGLDYRPSSGRIIGVTEDFVVVNIDISTGEVAEVTIMDTPLEFDEDIPVIVDINPVPDALRFMAGTVNHRVNLSSGEVTVDGDLHFGDDTDGEPMVGGTAYTNVVDGAEETRMFNIDVARGALLRQTAPNDGTIEVVGTLGVMFDGPIGFDVVTDSEGNDTAWLYANGMFHTVDLDNAVILDSWEIEALDVALRDIAVMTENDD